MLLTGELMLLELSHQSQGLHVLVQPAACLPLPALLPPCRQIREGVVDGHSPRVWIQASRLGRAQQRLMTTSQAALQRQHQTGACHLG